MSNKKDLSLIPKVLEGVIVADKLALNNKESIINEAIKNIKLSLQRTFEESINIGYYTQLIKNNSDNVVVSGKGKGKNDNVVVSENYKKAGLTDRTAQRYISVYKAFRELDSKKSLNVFHNIEQSKLYELARLSKANLNQLAKQPELIKTIENQTHQEFKQQLLPGLIQGNIEQLSKLQHEHNHTKKELEIVKTEKQQYKQALAEKAQQLDGNTPKLISDSKIVALVSAEAATHQIKKLSEYAKTLVTGRNSKEFVLSDASHQIDVKTQMSNAARLMLAQSSSFYNYVLEHLTPDEASLDPMSAQEIEQAESELKRVQNNLEMRKTEQRAVHGKS